MHKCTNIYSSLIIIAWSFPMHDVQIRPKNPKKSCPKHVRVSHVWLPTIEEHFLEALIKLCIVNTHFGIVRNMKFLVKFLVLACLKSRISDDSARFAQPLVLGCQLGYGEKFWTSSACTFLPLRPKKPSENWQFLQ